MNSLGPIDPSKKASTSGAANEQSRVVPGKADPNQKPYTPPADGMSGAGTSLVHREASVEGQHYKAGFIDPALDSLGSYLSSDSKIIPPGFSKGFGKANGSFKNFFSLSDLIDHVIKVLKNGPESITGRGLESFKENKKATNRAKVMAAGQLVELCKKEPSCARTVVPKLEALRDMYDDKYDDMYR